jgi:hypothetical protein
MARKPQPIVSTTGGQPLGGALPSGIIKGFDRVLAVQRPAVLAHIRGIRRHQPDASPAELVQILERRYLAAVTAGGAAVGASAVIPGVGTGITLALSGVETAGFLEATALFSQSVSEVHGISVDDPERARALVMTMMLGHEGSDLVRQLAGQATGAGLARNAYWGELVTNNIPRAIMGPLTDRLKGAFIRRFAARGGASMIGKAMPFGIGAAIGGAGNHIVGKRVVHSSRLAFGPAPELFRSELDPRVREVTVVELTGHESENEAEGNRIRRTAEAVAQGLSAGLQGVRSAIPRALPPIPRRRNRPPS